MSGFVSVHHICYSCQQRCLRPTQSNLRTSFLREDHLGEKLPFRIKQRRLSHSDFQLFIEWHTPIFVRDLPRLVNRIFDGLFDSDEFYHTLASVALTDMLRTGSAYEAISVISQIYRRIKALLMTREPASILNGLTILDAMMKALEQTTGDYVFSRESKQEMVTHYIAFKSTLGRITGERFIPLMQSVSQVLKRLKIYVDQYNIQKEHPKLIVEPIQLGSQKLDERVSFLIRGFLPEGAHPKDMWRREREKAWMQMKSKKASAKNLRRGFVKRGRLSSLVPDKDDSGDEDSFVSSADSIDLPPIGEQNGRRLHRGQ